MNLPWPECGGRCDHCWPEAHHACQRPEGHRGYHSCEPEDIDWEDYG